MGRIDPFIDPTGQMTETEVNAQTITQLVDEMNRNSDQLDSLSSGLAISSYGTAVINTATQSYVQVDTGFNTNTSNGVSFLAFMTRSDQSDIFQQLPYMVTAGGSPTTLNFIAFAQLGPVFPSPEIYLTFSVTAASGYVMPATCTFYYFILNQPVGAHS